MTLVRRESANYLRAERRRRARDRVPRTPTREAPPGSDGAWDVVDTLPRRLREVVVLKLVAGLTFEQIALSLHINPNTAAARYRSALELLRESTDAEDCVLSLGGTGNG